MTRHWLNPTLCLFCAALVGCIGIEHEDIGGDGSAGTGTANTAGDGDGDGDGETDTGDDGPKYDVSGDGDGDGDGDALQVPRLFVSGAGVGIWEVAEIQDGAMASANLDTADSLALALALGDDRLFVATADAQVPLEFFDAPASAADGAKPSGGVGVGPGFEGAALTNVSEMSVDAGGDLWIADGRIRRFEDAGSLAMNSAYAAVFEDAQTQQFVSAAHDATGAKLLGAHGTAGVTYWNAPLDDVGASVYDDVLAGPFGARRALIAGGDLFVASGDEPYLRVWNDIAGVAAPVVPDVTLGAAVNGLASPVHLFARGDTLVVTDDSNGGRVLIWTDVTNLAADQAADEIVGEGDLSAPTQAILGADGRLYVRDDTGFRVYADALENATLTATVDAQLGTTTDMVLLECTVDGDCNAGSCQHGTCG